jgi:hypothetical protein
MGGYQADVGERLRMRRANSIIKIISVFSILVGSSLAAPLKVVVTGTVTSTETTGGFVFENLGTQMAGYCTYDPETVDDEEGSSFYGRYNIDSLSMTIGDYTFADNSTTTPYPEFEVWVTDFCYKVSTIDGMVSINSAAQSYDDINIVLFDLGNFSISGPDDEIPTSFPDISFFSDRNEFEVDYSDADISFNVAGVIDSITVIPEPSSVLLLFLGGLLLKRKFLG